MADHNGLHAYLPQYPRKHVHNGRAHHLYRDHDGRSAGVHTQQDKLQDWSPVPHTAKHGGTIHTAPHKRHREAHQYDKDVIGHEFRVRVANSHIADDFGGDIGVGVLLDTGFKFHLKKSSKTPSYFYTMKPVSLGLAPPGLIKQVAALEMH